MHLWNNLHEKGWMRKLTCSFSSIFHSSDSDSGASPSDLHQRIDPWTQPAVPLAPIIVSRSRARHIPPKLCLYVQFLNFFRKNLSYSLLRWRTAPTLSAYRLLEYWCMDWRSNKSVVFVQRSAAVWRHVLHALNDWTGSDLIYGSNNSTNFESLSCHRWQITTDGGYYTVSMVPVGRVTQLI